MDSVVQPSAAEQQDPLAAWHVPLEDLSFDDVAPLGSGALGEVKRATWTNNGLKLATKRLFFMATDAAAIKAMGGALDTQARETVLQDFIKECSINASLRHPNIVMFLGVAVDRSANNKPQFLLMELMSHSLHDEIYPGGAIPRQGNPMELARMASILLDISRALAYLHSRHPPVLHLDLKPTNVLIDRSGTAKLADLGEAHVIQSARRATVGAYGVGTPLYMAPEMKIEGVPRGPAADMFSLGLIVCEMSLGRTPSANDAKAAEQNRAADLQAMKHVELQKIVEHLVIDEADQRWDALRVQAFLQVVADV